jgi:hypothetical protein
MIQDWLLRCSVLKMSAFGNAPIPGNFFENLIIVEFLKRRFNAGNPGNLFFGVIMSVMNRFTACRWQLNNPGRNKIGANYY